MHNKTQTYIFHI